MVFLTILRNNIKLFQNGLAVGAFLFLANCVMLPNQIKPSENGPQISQEAVVAFNVYGKGPGGMKEKYSIQSVFQEVGTEKYITTFTSIEDPEVFHIKAGTYFIKLLVASDVVIPTGLGIGQYDMEKNIPVMPIEIRPGEVLYLGTLYVDGLRHNAQVWEKKPNVTYKVIDEYEKILDELNKKYPQYADQMKVRLFKIIE